MATNVVGRWTEVFGLSNVAVHVSLLPTGKVLYFGRRSNPKSTDKATLDEHATKAFVWDPATRTSKPTANEPLGRDNKPVNLFCAGHCLLPNGTVLIVGGHIKDGQGANQACIYDPATNRFTAKALMNKGRWYPSAITLPDGRAIVFSGSDIDYHPNNIPQIWPGGNANSWVEVTDPFVQRNQVLPLYPRVHMSPKGKIFWCGPQPQSFFLELKDDKGKDVTANVGGKVTLGNWVAANTARQAGVRDYAPSVMYDSGKIMYIGGGNDGAQPAEKGPTNVVEFINLNDATPKWTSSPSTNLKIPRRQFNATILPDGTVFVTGGTKGPGFNDLNPASTVHQSELYDPVGKKWTNMAVEAADRCYHSTALLLPDGRVLSAGGGEYGDAAPKDCLTNAQLFEPPYLFKGARPTLSNAPAEINYGKEFQVTVGANDAIDRISLLRLGSVTHCRNMNQSLMFLRGFKQTGTKVAVPAPANANLSPPGHYLLFVLNKQGVPSVGSIVHISPAPTAAPKTATHVMDVAHHDIPSAAPVQPSLLEHSERIKSEQDRPPVVVGLTPACPYGLGPCWNGAYDALHGISDIKVVGPLPDQADSVAFVYLEKDILPDIDVWRTQFEKVANQSYNLRGIEMTIPGLATKNGEKIILASTPTGLKLTLSPFQEASQLKWDVTRKAAKPISDTEVSAYKRLSEALAPHPQGATVRVTGTLQKHGAGEFSLDIRDFAAISTT